VSPKDPPFDGFVLDCRALFGDELESVFLYGSAAGGEFRPDLSDYNLAIVLRAARPETLRRASRRAGRWRRWGFGTPLVLDSRTVREGAPIFPIEFGEMKRAHRMLFGADLFLDLPVPTENLRRQCEFELRAKLLALRQAYLREAGSAASALRLAQESLKSFLIVMRNALMLLGESPPTRLADVLDRVEARWDLALPTWRRVLATRMEGVRVKRSEMAALVGAYLEEAAALVAHFGDPLDRADQP
jgi:predicted nucleotidyltransferase